MEAHTALTERSKLSAREKLVKELLDTEAAHVGLLELFINEYLLPLRETELVGKEDLFLICSNIELIQAWHQQFFRALKKRLKRDLAKPFADVLLHMVPMLRQLYTQYCENYERALATYERLKLNKALVAFLGSRQEKTGRDFLSFLYIPIGRMIAYDTLLNSILSHTARSDMSDHRDVARALQTVRAVTRHANERALQRKNIDRVLAIQDSICDDTIPTLAVPHRRYVYDANVTWLASGKELKDRRLFLFNDLMICVRPSKKSRATTKMWDVDFLIGDLHSTTIDDKENEGDPYKFCVRTPQLSYHFSSHEKTAWIQLLQDVVGRLNKPNNALMSSEPMSENIQEITKEQLISQILEWSKSDDAEAVLLEVKELAHALSDQMDEE